MYALVDCNNFFVSCERVFRPQLEGKAVVVLSNNDGCVVARSNESKAMGIRMGTPFYQVRDMVKAGRLIACSSNYTMYGDLSSRVMSILAEAVPRIEIYSIDEAFLCMDGMSPEKIEGISRELVAKVRKWVGIPVSIGIAPTKTLAKIASHFAKKYPGYRGVCRIDSEEKRLKALSLTPIREVWGVGRKLSVSMEQKGIRTALDYVQRPEEWVRKNYMLHGVRTWLELRGQVCVEEELHEKRKSICTSRSFPGMITDRSEIAARVADFAAKCAQKLREEHSAARQVDVVLYTNRFRDDLPQYFPCASVRLPVAASSTQEIVSAALKGFGTIYRPDYRYKKAGVTVSDLVDADAVQASLFDYDIDLRRKQDRLSEIMDRINAGGHNLVRLAAQRSGDYTDGIRSDYRSRRYSTSLDEVIEVR
ncbi:MAG: Y-family DNA polymerase [Bacteroidetes bacterium]|uniref:Y-family DNA polymerase n=1 Tax=Candidatus Cryptobacteroides gallistercoris TaxID=2840765 RepID=A0A940DMQ2_9BACT|nr:Y-family DNA polymerase [Candidatus Cryptobacteroides gallistercoris]